MPTNHDENIDIRIENVNFKDLQKGDWVNLLPLQPCEPLNIQYIEKIDDSGTVHFAHPAWHDEDFSGEKVQPFGEFKTSYYSASKEFTHLNYQVFRTIKVPNYFRMKARSNCIFENMVALNDFLAHFWDR